MKDETYRFKIRASNFCRNGEYSDELGVTITDVLPCQMDKVFSTSGNCAINFSWMEPTCKRKSPNARFNIEVMGIDKSFY